MANIFVILFLKTRKYAFSYIYIVNIKAIMRRYSIFDSGSQGKRCLTATIVNTFLAKIVKLHFPSTAKIFLKTCLQKSNIGYSQ